LKSKGNSPHGPTGYPYRCALCKGFVWLYFLTWDVAIKKVQYLDKIAVVLARRAATNNFHRVKLKPHLRRLPGKVNKAMRARHAKLLFLMLIVLVTLLFFVHVPSGSFQARNGPTTPVNNIILRVALCGLLLLLRLSGIAVSHDLALNTPVGHFSPIFLHSPSASSIGISLRC
jgi:hypothetical protein